MSIAYDRQVQAVRVRLLLPNVVAKMETRGIDAEELQQVLTILLERHGLHAPNLERLIDTHYWNWKRDPRMTLVEYVRQVPDDRG